MRATFGLGLERVYGERPLQWVQLNSERKEKL